MPSLSELTMDPVKSVEGVWVGWEVGIKLLIARDGNPKHRTLAKRRLDPHGKDIANGTMDKDVLENIVKEVAAQTILLDWKNVTDPETDEPIAYSPEEGVKAFNTEGLERFYEFVIAASKNIARYRRDRIKDVVGN
jgi:hypothetical protein